MATILQSLSLTEADARMIPVATVLFFMLYGALSRLLFQPLLSLIAEREKRTVGFEDASGELKERAQEIRNRVEVKASLAEAEVQQERRAMLETARKEAAEILGKAEQTAADMIKKGRTETAPRSWILLRW
jgi:F0F1-type ATP synthase membrane subunit b/b'